MTAYANLRGVMPAILTPMDAEGRFLPGAFEQLLEFVYTRGADGIYVCGQTGEGLQQPVAQRKLVVESAVQHTPSGKFVMAHIGAPSTADAVELARHAESCGAHSISSLPPGGSYSIDEVHGYYSAIAAATSCSWSSSSNTAASPADNRAGCRTPTGRRATSWPPAP